MRILKRDARIKFYRWFRFGLLRQNPECYPTGAAKWMSALLFPIDWLYNNQNNLRYFYETDTYLIRGSKLRGRVFDYLAKTKLDAVTLRLDEHGKWCIDQVAKSNA